MCIISDINAGSRDLLLVSDVVYFDTNVIDLEDDFVKKT